MNEYVFFLMKQYKNDYLLDRLSSDQGILERSLIEDDHAWFSVDLLPWCSY